MMKEAGRSQKNSRKINKILKIPKAFPDIHIKCRASSLPHDICVPILSGQLLAAGTASLVPSTWFSHNGYPVAQPC